MDIWSCSHGWSYQCSKSHTALCSLQYQVAHTCTSHSTCHTPCCTSLASSEDYTSACTNLHNLNPKSKNKKYILVTSKYIYIYLTKIRTQKPFIYLLQNQILTNQVLWSSEMILLRNYSNMQKWHIAKGLKLHF